MAAYEQIITDAMRDGGLLDALLSMQKAEGYVSEELQMNDPEMVRPFGASVKVLHGCRQLVP